MGVKTNKVEWQAISELLNDGHYEQAAELLNNFQIPQHDNDPYPAHILATVRQICLVCKQVQAETELHQQAYYESAQRERELQQQLALFLDLVNQYLEPGNFLAPDVNRSAEAGLKALEERTPGVGNGRSWWQRLRTWLGLKATKTNTQVESPTPRHVEAVAHTAVSATEPSNTITKIPSLVIYCFGSFRVYQNDQLITNWNSLKGQSIFKYVVAHRSKPIAKDILMDVFWPDCDTKAARRNLHQAIYCLRQTLRRRQPDFQHIQYENDCYLLNPNMDIWLDIEEFEKHDQAGQRLLASGRLSEGMAAYGIAEGLFQGDFLEEDLYEEWLQLRREQMRAKYLDITERLSKYYLKQKEYVAAVALCQKMLAREICCETAHRLLMRCYQEQGQRYLAIRQYQICRETLTTELNLEPSEETTTLYRQLIA